MSILATGVWIADQGGGDWVEGEPGELRVEREDEGSVSLGVRVRGDSDSIVTLHLPLREANRLALSIAAASHDE